MSTFFSQSPSSAEARNSGREGGTPPPSRDDLPVQADGAGLFVPTAKLCTDNGAMIAEAGTWALARGERAPLALSIDPGLSL